MSNGRLLGTMMKLRRPKVTFQSAYRLHKLLLDMDESTREYYYEQFRRSELELRIQAAVTKQLEAELQADLYRDHKNGVDECLLYQKLPPEIRHQIFSHVVSVEQSVHVFPPKGNESHGFRLSLCDESAYDFEYGHCRCEDGRIGVGRNRHSDFFNNASFLVSRQLRREALDAFFAVNKFTFTSFNDLLGFSSRFKRSSRRIQHLRLFERVDDYPPFDHRNKGAQVTRKYLKALKNLEVHLFISNWSSYESLHEDGLVHEMLHFALGPQPLTEMEKARKRNYSEFSVEDENLSLIADDSDQWKDKSGGKECEGPQQVAQTKSSVVTTSNTSQSAPQSSFGPSKQFTEEQNQWIISRAAELANSTSREQRSNIAYSMNPQLWQSIREKNLNPLAYYFRKKAEEAFESQEAQQNGRVLESSSTLISTSKDSDSMRKAIEEISNDQPRFKFNCLPETKKAPNFPIPPLRLFEIHVRMQSFRVGRVGPEAAYHDKLCDRLSEHLKDVFMDCGRKYATVEDVPSLGPKPKTKTREDEKPLVGAQKRGIMFLND